MATILQIRPVVDGDDVEVELTDERAPGRRHTFHYAADALPRPQNLQTRIDRLEADLLDAEEFDASAALEVTAEDGTVVDV